MVGAAYHFPRITMIADVPSPCQRFIADTNAFRRSRFAQRGKIICRTINAAQTMRRHIRTDQHQIDAQLVHQIKFALGAVKSTIPQRIGHTFKIAEGLEQHYLKPMILDHGGNIFWPAIKGDKILFKNFNTGKTGAGDRRQLFPKITCNRHRGDTAFHTCRHFLRHPQPNMRQITGSGLSHHQTIRIAIFINISNHRCRCALCLFSF